MHIQTPKYMQTLYICISNIYTHAQKHTYACIRASFFTLGIRNVFAFLVDIYIYSLYLLRSAKGKVSLCQQHVLENSVSQYYPICSNNGSRIHTQSAKLKLKFELTEMYRRPFSPLLQVTRFHSWGFYIFGDIYFF